MTVPKIDALQEALESVLTQNQASQLAWLIYQMDNRHISQEQARQQFAVLQEQLPATLAGKEVRGPRAMISFGEGNQFGDISVGDVAAGSIAKFYFGPLTVNINVGALGQPAAPRRPRVYISHFAAEPQAAAALEELKRQLAQNGFEVLPDGERLKDPAWKDSQYMWMGLAHAAVLFLSRSALAFPWVRTEARILTGRFILKKIFLKQFVLLPVLLDDVQPAELEAVFPGLSGLGLAPLQASSADAGALAQQVLAGLQDLAAMAKNEVLGETALEELARQISEELKNAEKPVLKECAGMLKLDLKGLSEVDIPQMVASALWHSDLETWAGVMDKLNTSSQVNLKGLVEKAIPAWVNPCAAGALLEAARPGAARRVIVVNGEEVTFTSHSFVHRAFYQVLKNECPIAEVPNLSAEFNQDPVQVIWNQIKMQVFSAPEKEAMSQEEVRRKLQLLQKRKPVFIAFPPPAPKPDVMEKILAEFPGVIFLFLAGAKPLADALPALLPLDPALKEQEERSAKDYYDVDRL